MGSPRAVDREYAADEPRVELRAILSAHDPRIIQFTRKPLF